MRLTLSALGAALLCGVIAPSAHASGYHFGSQSAAAQGTANANSAEAADATLLFYNPAGAMRLEGTHVSGVLNLVLPRGKFADEGSTTQFGLPTGGGDGGRFVEPTAVPHAYITHRVSSDVAVGLGVFVPFGSKSDYDPDWSGRYNAIGTELKTMAINPSVAFKLNESVSLGAGVTAQWMHGKLAKASDYGSGALASIVDSQVAAQLAANPGAPEAVVRAAVLNQLSGLIGSISGNPLYSGRDDIEGHDWGFGFNFGAMFKLDEDTRFGIAYRSRIHHRLQGHSDWTVVEPAARLAATLNAAIPGAGTQIQNRLLAAYTDSDASLKVDTPESLSVSIYRQQGKLAAMADVTLTRHERFQELRVDFANSLPDSTTPQRWTNTVRLAFGLSYQLSDALKLRGGVAFDGSPVTVANRTASIPDNDRTWLSAGANWKLDPKRSVDFALSYIHIGGGQVDNYDNGAQVNAAGSAVCNRAANTSSCATIKGSFDLSSLLLGIQYNQQF